MILFELVEGGENHPAYRAMEASNGERHYGFLEAVVKASLAVERPFLSQTVLKALNYHAIACLHPYAGEYRPCPVYVGEYKPPEHYRVGALMDDFVNGVNRHWDSIGAVGLAAYVLWRLNYIHPFINGNGRTARAACYFVLCVKSGAWLSGKTILPARLRAPENRELCVEALKHADKTAKERSLDLEPLAALLAKLLHEQRQSAQNA